MMHLFKKVHKWVGLLIGAQVLLWLLSGLMISLLDPEKVSGNQWAFKTSTVPQTLEPMVLLEPAELPQNLLKDALGIELTDRYGKPFYLVRHANSESLIDAMNASVVEIEQSWAEQAARKDFIGIGEVVSIESGMAPDRETRDSEGAYWRVNFSDMVNTAIYISASTGEILERRNSFWRVRDFFWMLHIMDYPDRENFNNPLVITVALIAIWLGISGFMLLFGSFTRSDFFFLKIPGKTDEVVITLTGPGVRKPKTVKLRKGSNLFLSLATHDVSLASICGGGGECGKCRVKIESSHWPEANAIELGLVPKRLREQGYRLACQQKAERDMTLNLPEGTLVSSP